VSLTTAIIAGAVSASSVQAAPIGLAKTISAVAIAKGAATGGSTLALVKGALKLMALTKAKTAALVGVGILLAAGTTTMTVKEIQEHRTYPWQVQIANSDVLRKMPPQVGIAPSKYSNSMGAGTVSVGDANGNLKTLGIALPLKEIISFAYGQPSERTVFEARIPWTKYDFIANLPSGNEEALQREIKGKFGVVGNRQMRATDVLLLKIENPNSTGLKPADPSRLKPNEGDSSENWGNDYLSSRNRSLSDVARFAENRFQIPVIDETEITNHFDIDLKWDETDFQHPNLDNLKQALLDQLGLELVPTNMPVEMLVVEKSN
jgi:uncharacterized protein (TIGR03435 family)